MGSVPKSTQLGSAGTSRGFSDMSQDSESQFPLLHKENKNSHFLPCLWVWDEISFESLTLLPSVITQRPCLYAALGDSCLANLDIFWTSITESFPTFLYTA
jgi:hypothetical protein